jgi:hypothetical protein
MDVAQILKQHDASHAAEQNAIPKPIDYQIDLFNLCAVDVNTLNVNDA